MHIRALHNFYFCSFINIRFSTSFIVSKLLSCRIWRCYFNQCASSYCYHCLLKTTSPNQNIQIFQRSAMTSFTPIFYGSMISYLVKTGFKKKVLFSRIDIIQPKKMLKGDIIYWKKQQAPRLRARCCTKTGGTVPQSAHHQHKWDCTKTVSYTHLTLPTSDLV